MKKLISALCSLVIATGAWAQTGVVTVEGHVKGVPDSTRIGICVSGTIPTTTRILDGRFTLQLPVTEADKNNVFLSDGGDKVFAPMVLFVYAMPGVTVHVEGENNLIYTWKVISPLPEQAERERFVEASRKEWDEYQPLLAPYNALVKRFMTAQTEEEKDALRPEVKRMSSQIDSLDYIIASNTLAVLEKSGTFSDVALDELSSLARNVAEQSKIYGDLRERVTALYENLPDDQKTSTLGRETELYLFPLEEVKIGSIMPDVELLGSDGEVHKLSEYRGKYVLLDFWASWCGWCIEAFPEVRKAWEANSDKLTVLGVNLDETPEKWAQASAEHNITWENLHSPGLNSEIANRFRVDGIPHQAVISPEGMVLYSWSGYGEGELRRILQKLIPDFK